MGVFRADALRVLQAATDARRAKKHREQVELKERAVAEAKKRAAKLRQEEVNRVVAQQLEHKAMLKRKVGGTPFGNVWKRGQAVTCADPFVWLLQDAAQDARIMRRLEREQAAKLREEQMADYELRLRNMEYGQEVLDQIADKAARKREVVNEKYEERKRLNLERRIENELLEKMKQDAIKRLAKEQGVGIEWSRDILRVEVESKKVTK